MRLNTALSREKELLYWPASQFTFCLNISFFLFFFKQVEHLPEQNKISAWKDEYSDTHLNFAAPGKE